MTEADSQPGRAQIEPLDLGRLMDDLRYCAEVVDVEFNPAVVETTIDALADVCPRAWIGMRTTTQPARIRDLNFRVCYRDPVHPVPRLRSAGLLEPGDHAVGGLLDQIAERFAVWWGVDASVRGRADKIWVVADDGIALADLLTLPNLPESVAAARDHFERTGMDRVGLIAMDFTRHTVNLYSPVFPPGTLSETAIRGMLTGLGFAVPGAEEMRLNGEAFDFYQTFSWDEPGIRRLCYPMRLTPERFPTHLDSVLRDFVERAPFAAATREFVFYTTYGPRGGYYKVQSDYTGNHRQTFVPQ